MDPNYNQEFLKAMQSRWDKKLVEKELEVITYWKGQLDKVTSMRPESMASVLVQVSKVSEMMANRMASLRKGSS
jgi:hypothetical protein